MPRLYLVAGLAVSLALAWWLLSHRYWPTSTGLDIGGAQVGRDFINVWMAPYLASHGQAKTLIAVRGVKAPEEPAHV